jgi:hypothetical protein
MVNEFKIATLWDGTKVDAADQVSVSIDVVGPGVAPESPKEPCLVISVDSPFFNDPAPPEGPSKNLDGLWNYEVVEVFIKGRHDKYVEIEMGPHGHYLVLVCDGYRQCFLRGIEPISYTATKNASSTRWIGRMVCPLRILPPPTDIPTAPFSFNAYAIRDDLTRPGERIHAAVFAPFRAEEEYAVPDFHKLELFEHFPAAFSHSELFSSPGDESVWNGRTVISMGVPRKTVLDVGEESPKLRE